MFKETWKSLSSVHHVQLKTEGAVALLLTPGKSVTGPRLGAGAQVHPSAPDSIMGRFRTGWQGGAPCQPPSDSGPRDIQTHCLGGRPFWGKGGGGGGKG